MKITFMLEKIQGPPLFIDCVIGLEVALDVFLRRLVMKNGAFTKVYVDIKTLVLNAELYVFNESEGRNSTGLLVGIYYTKALEYQGQVQITVG